MTKDNLNTNIPQQPFNAERYKKTVAQSLPKSRLGRSLFRAFWVGGLICVLGQGLHDLAAYAFKWSEDAVSAFVCISLIVLAQLLTAFGLFDRIGSYAGAGTVVPITGFANSIAAPAIEYRSEGLIMGVGAKLFSIAGPVLVYGIGASVLAGLISLIF
jgi:stage V sporulation protein AC